MIANKTKQKKHLDFFIDGDEALRKRIFKESPLSQQAVFDLFSLLDETHFMFFLFYSAIPSTKGLWELFLIHLTAIASGTSKNRNYCEDYRLLSTVKGVSHCGVVKEKGLLLMGAAHGLWWEMADPNYKEQPDTHALWLALMATGPSRQVWEWWFEARCKEAEIMWAQYSSATGTTLIEMEADFEAWAEKHFGLVKPRTHWFPLVQMMLDTYHKAMVIKHKIALPYQRLAYTVAKAILARTQPHQFFDTFDIACGGLMRSISKYAPSLSMSFPKFAKEEIKYEIFYQLGNYNLINLPNEMWQLYRKYEHFKSDYIIKKQKYPSIKDLSQHYNLDYESVFEVYFLVGLQNPFSLDTKVYPDDDSARPITLKEKIEDVEEKEVKRLAENVEVILLSLKRLSLKHRKIFGLTHNFCDLLQEIEPDPVELQRFFSKPFCIVK